MYCKIQSNKLYVDWEVECQFSDYKNNALAFGRSNRNANGKILAA